MRRLLHSRNKIMNYKTKISETYDSLATRYDGCERINGARARVLAQTLAPRAGERVLDLAAGTGLCTLALRECAPDLSVVATDLSKEMLYCAYTKIGRGAQFAVQDAEHLALASNYFDVVNCGMGVYLFPQLVDAMREMYRVAKPGGRVGFSFPGRGLPQVEEAIGQLVQTYMPAVPLLQQPESKVMAQGFESALASVGFTHVRSNIVPERILFPDMDALAQALEGSGVRALFLGVDAPPLPDSVWQEFLAIFQRLCATSGGVLIQSHVIIVMGERPAA
jgi:ubiquinone/menaquinone biosynthesis C-methylase UbiE